jgi:putative hemolysin
MDPPRNAQIFSLKVKIKHLPRPLVGAIGRFLDRLLGFRQFNAIYAGLPPCDTDDFARTLLEAMDVHVELTGAARETIPLSGPLMVIANHPFGMIEGMALGALLSSLRRDVTVMVLHLLAAIPEYRDRLIFVDPRRSRKKRLQGARGWLQSRQWLADGGVLAVFPAGRVAHFDWRRLAVVDRPWSPHVAALARRSGVPVLPVYFHGHNGWLFQLAGMFSPALHEAFLMRQLTNKRGRTLKAVLGRVIPASELAAFAGDQEAIAFLRRETEMLARR